MVYNADMKAKELKEIIDRLDPESEVKVCVNTPGGWICPDGCTVGIKDVGNGFDWHAGEILIVPEHKLDIHDVEEWKRS